MSSRCSDDEIAWHVSQNIALSLSNTGYTFYIVFPNLSQAPHVLAGDQCLATGLGHHLQEGAQISARSRPALTQAFTRSLKVPPLPVRFMSIVGKEVGEVGVLCWRT